MNNDQTQPTQVTPAPPTQASAPNPPFVPNPAQKDGALFNFNYFGYIAIAMQIVESAAAVLGALSSGQPVTIPAIRTYVRGQHIEIGPIPVKILP